MTAIERERLIDEYYASVRQVRLAYIRARRRRDNDGDEKAAVDCQHLSAMERDLAWTIRYLETGNIPEYRRGIYKLAVPVDPHVLQRVVKVRHLDELEGRWVAFDRDLNKLLGLLAPREREAFIMVRGRGLSYRLTAEYMGLRSPGAVFNLVRRAERKLRRIAIGYELAQSP